MVALEKVSLFIIGQKLIQPNQKVVLGFSGGPDSVFLAHVLIHLQQNIPFSLNLAHLDHGWRATSSNDAQFCLQFAKKNNFHASLGLAHDFASAFKFNGSKEEFARNIRKAFFKKVMLDTQSDLLALAHHADDQLETFFIRIMRGTTISGLKSMLPKEGHIIRPLLNVSKKEILHFLDEHNIPYCIDETNKSELFLRNRIRNKAIPACQEADERFTQNSLRTINHLAEVETYLAKNTQEIFNNISLLFDNQLTIDIQKLMSIDLFMQRRLVIYWLCTEKVPFNPSEKLIHEILRFLQNKKAMAHTVHNWTIHKKNLFAWINHLN
ncbi:tRNA lysidine(34) synthetase TilS [Candidatus Dependentiae bacterium]|nr:MAG: tRNA lysidine(34) synthetase TilS [Candidatus Dependentiae bacterium]